jgi:hypothetical protein
MSWEAAGAFVWHETDVSPEQLAQELTTNGFGWVAVFLADGLVEDPVEDDWVIRFRRASGLPIGGWSVLRARPVEEALLSEKLVERHVLDFFIANAEADYAYSDDAGADAGRFARSQRFVSTFRRLLPTIPAGLSSYCRTDAHDLDWNVWREAKFVFLPQAYVNDFGAAAAPEICVAGSSGHFPLTSIHPTVGMYPGVKRSLRAAGYARLLAHAGTVGFSIYLAETRMIGEEWREFGSAIARLRIARTG